MQFSGPSRSRLNAGRRFKAVLPAMLALGSLAVYVAHIQSNQPFAIHDIPEDDRIWVERMIFFGLDRIESAGFHLSWDKRTPRAKPAKAQPETD